MNTPDLPKVCHPVLGIPAIVRAIEMYDRCGIEDHYVVVGDGRDQVARSLSSAPGNHIFCVQPKPLGTGNAAKAAADRLRSDGYAGDILLVAGDKVIDESILRRLIDTFYSDDCDLAFAVGEATDFPTSGRVMCDDAGRPLRIVEVKDLTEHGPAHSARYANLSVYLFRAESLYTALNGLNSDNAQHEEYLTDTVGVLAETDHKVKIMAVDDPEQIMGFNTPEELREIEKRLRRKADAEEKDHFSSVSIEDQPTAMHPASHWFTFLADAGGPVRRELEAIYGTGHPKVAGARRHLSAMLERYIRRFGDGPVVLARAPGRVNLMGRHVDHQGGHANMVAIDRDTWMVAGTRSDRTFHLHDLASDRFPDRDFGLAGLIDGFTADWHDFVDSESVRSRGASAGGDWAQYVRGALARLQAHAADRPLAGMNFVVSGDLPIAAGLSSSSSMVVATMEAACALNGISIPSLQFAELCGEAEWYVGTRGGAGDQAAQKLARYGKVMPIGFFPLTIEDPAEFPAEYALIVCNSGISARKTEGARDRFNHRVACYFIGTELLEQAFPKAASRVEHLRDWNPDRLEISEAELLAMIGTLPERMSRHEAERALPADSVDRILGTHSEEMGGYPVRSVVLYGIAECERGRRTGELLRNGRVEEFGQWMNVSHDGDRVVKPVHTDQAGRPLVLQTGAYGCSVPEIDRMVDISLSVVGVVGAQISGAGLGGCIMALVLRDSCAALQKALVDGYYAPAGIEPDVIVCTPVGGSGVFKV
jgi:N-acetylgalactosamine kinase